MVMPKPKQEGEEISQRISSNLPEPGDSEQKPEVKTELKKRESSKKEEGKQVSQREESKETPSSQLVGKKRGRPPKGSDSVIGIKHQIVKNVLVSQKTPISIQSTP